VYFKHNSHYIGLNVFDIGSVFNLDCLYDFVELFL